MKLIKEKTREITLAIVILAIGIIIATQTPSFFSINNISNLLNNNAVIGIMAVGMMVIIATGNIDLSVGPQLAVAGMLTAYFVRATSGENILIAILIGAITGAILGSINGLFVSIIKIPSIVVTLGTMNVFRGLLYFVTNGNMIEDMSGPFLKFSIKLIGPFSVATYIWFFVMIFTWFMLYRTQMGRNILAVGGNKVAAARIGINATKVYLFSFTFMGILSGLAGVLMISKIKMAHPTAGLNYDMSLIAATVVGGTSFGGGVASILGTFLGVILLGVISNGLVIARIPVMWQDLATGIIIILSVASSAYKRTEKRKSEPNTDSECADKEVTNE